MLSFIFSVILVSADFDDHKSFVRKEYINRTLTGINASSVGEALPEGHVLVTVECQLNGSFHSTSGEFGESLLTSALLVV